MGDSAKKSGAFDRFEELLNRYLGPIAEKMDKQRHLSAVKKAMVAMTPLLLIGSFCLIPSAIPNMIGEGNPISQWILANTSYFDLAYNVSMGLMSVFVAMVAAYHLAKSYDLDIPGSLCMALTAFLLLGMEMDEAGGIALSALGSKGLFVSMFAALVAVELYRWCKKRNFTIKMPDSVPDFISSSFEIIPVTIIVIGVMPNQIVTNLLAPLVGSMDSPLAVTFYHTLRCFFSSSAFTRRCFHRSCSQSLRSSWLRTLRPSRPAALRPISLRPGRCRHSVDSPASV